MAPTAPPPNHGRMVTSAFRPAWWLRNPHLQTCWPTLARRRPLNLKRQRLELPDGDFLDLAWTRTPEPGSDNPLIALLHGLEGSADSPYAVGLLRAVEARGWVGVVMHFRGCSGSPNRLPRSYHAGETGDFAWLLEHLSHHLPQAPLAAVGYSVGGNVLLKYLGEVGGDTPLRAAVAVCPPVHLAACAHRLERGLSRGYQRYLLAKLKTSLTRKLGLPGMDGMLRLPSGGLEALNTLRAYDDAVTAPLHGFAGADDYYARCSAKPYLQGITIPTLVVHATDDPFMTPAVVPDPRHLSEWVCYEVSSRGGHVGFITAPAPGRSRYWLEHRIPAYLSPHLAEIPDDTSQGLLPALAMLS